jgi:hypothetical protein
MPESSSLPSRSPGRPLRALSAVALGFASLTAVLLIVLRLIHLFRPDVIRWNLKSAIPLMLVGIAFALLQFGVSRTRIQIVLGLSVSAAFVFWGVEQFVSSQFVASSIDDFVVFLFVLDLSLVIYQHLRSTDRAAAADLPFVPSNEIEKSD